MTDRPQNRGFPIASNREAYKITHYGGGVLRFQLIRSQATRKQFFLSREYNPVEVLFPTNPIASNREATDEFWQLCIDQRFQLIRSQATGATYPNDAA
jgi:hypothetical protein